MRRDDGQEDDLLTELAALLPEPPAKVLSVGVAEGTVQALRERRSGLELAAAEDPAEPADAVLWDVEGAAEEPAAVASAARRRLGDGGTLVAVAPARGERTAGGRGGLPRAEERVLRSVVRELSEAGFAIRREKRVVGPGGDGRALLVARPDRFAIRSYQDGDEAAVLELFPTCFHVPRSVEHHRWKYLENPYGDRFVSMAFSPEGRLAAHYAGYPVPFWRLVGGEPRELLALQMGDTMTDPTLRHATRGRSGLLPRTVRHFFARHRDGTFRFFYGFNTGPIQRFCRWFIGGSRVDPVRYWRRDLDPAPGWRAAGYRVERVEQVGPAWDRLFRRTAPHYRFLARRDARYLHWRYLRCPDPGHVLLAARRWGRLVGWGVFRRREDRLTWGDALFHPRHARAAEAVLATAVGTPDLAGAPYLEAWFADHPTWWRRELERLGLQPAPEPNDLGFMALSETEEDAAELLRELYYTMGDGDLF